MNIQHTRGRPRIHTDDDILAAAMNAFSEFGYEAMSVRLLNRDLGLSHGTISQRFGPKQQLFSATIDWAKIDILKRFTYTKDRVWNDDLDELYDRFYEYLLVVNQFPQVIRFIQKEGTARTEQMDYVKSTMATNYLDLMASCLVRLQKAAKSTC